LIYAIAPPGGASRCVGVDIGNTPILVTMLPFNQVYYASLK
jgi:hypothetical protein